MAYPARPTDIGETIERAKDLSASSTELEISTWARDDLGGQQLIQPIVKAIQEADVVAADVTALNFNVTYELGYAIGLGKRVLPLQFQAYPAEDADILAIGLYDTLLRQSYADADGALNHMARAETGQRIATNYPADPSPLFIVLPQIKTDDITSLVSRSRRAGLIPRTFDPGEQPRLSASQAVKSVAVSTGIVIPLLDPARSQSSVHNLRCAFVAGVSHALGRPTLLLKKGDWATPLDIRDEVETYHNDEQLQALFTRFAERVHEAKYAMPTSAAGNRSDLSEIYLGDPAAENEEASLQSYFLERGEFRQVLEGRTNVVVGRKGAGKTAVYVRARDQLRDNRAKIIVDLSPEAHQLKQLKDVVLQALAAGSKEFLLSAFWEYVLLLEVCAKILEKDQDIHKRNHKLFEPYQRLLAVFRADPVTEGASFSDRLLKLIDRIAERHRSTFGTKSSVDLSRDQLTNILYETTLPDLRSAIELYALEKDGIHVLFDNLDKGWNAEGLEETDIIMIRTLLDAGRKMENDFRRSGTDFHCTIFLRNDIFEMLLSKMADRGKLTRVLVDWQHADLLKQMIRRRLAFAFGTPTASLESMWNRICVPIIESTGESSLDYMVHRSLMRPRYLLRLLNYCLANAVNFERSRIEWSDIELGESAYSTDVITEVDLEIRDVLTESHDVLYAFIGEPKEMRQSHLLSLLTKTIKAEQDRMAILLMLLWHGVVGFRRGRDELKYIFDVNYDLKRLQASMSKFGEDDPMLQVNPAFWTGLELCDAE